MKILFFVIFLSFNVSAADLEQVDLEEIEKESQEALQTETLQDNTLQNDLKIEDLEEVYFEHNKRLESSKRKVRER